MGKVKVICDNCGNEIERYPSELKGHKHCFCNHRCMGEWRSREQSGEQSPKYNKIITLCDNCGNELKLERNQFAAGKHHFCNSKCMGEWKTKNLKGKNSPFYNREEIYGDWCGKMILIEPYKLKTNKHHFHSKKCADEWKRHPSEEEREKFREIRRHQKIPMHHTKPELIFKEICNKYNLPFKYTGDVSLWIGKDKKKLNPDFVECNGKKIVVEIFGDYWHSRLLNRNLREDAGLNYRKRHYSHYHWKSVFIWESDLLREDAEAFVLHTLREESVIY